MRITRANTKAAALAGVAAMNLTAFQASADTLSGLPLLEAVAPGAIQISPHVPHMGEHWATAENLPAGPIYCVIDGRVSCVEFMFDLADLESGTDWLQLFPGIETPPITHVDIEFKPEGIPPHPVPLYQLHIYFAGPGTLASY